MFSARVHFENCPRLRMALTPKAYCFLHAKVPRCQPSFLKGNTKTGLKLFLVQVISFEDSIFHCIVHVCVRALLHSLPARQPMYHNTCVVDKHMNTSAFLLQHFCSHLIVQLLSLETCPCALYQCRVVQYNCLHFLQCKYFYLLVQPVLVKQMIRFSSTVKLLIVQALFFAFSHSMQM